MKTIFLIEYLIICSTITSFAQLDTSKTKLDAIQTKQVKSSELLTSTPLSYKTFGIGFNPLRLLSMQHQSSNDFERYLRAAISVFSIDRQAELAFPVQYMWGKYYNNTWRDFYCEVTYRRFISCQQKGYYYSGGLRFLHIEGEELGSKMGYYGPLGLGNIIVQNKIGIYAGFGYRHCSKNGMYWGSNIILGIYFGPKTPNIATAEDVQYNWIMGCDLLEIGYAF
jgi:hypothetical protein